jgi:hypothetical protein
LLAAGAVSPVPADVDRAGSVVSRYLEQANEALRRVFGTATLPENVAPSELQAPPETSAVRR